MNEDRCRCGGQIIFSKPHFIPLRTDSIMQIIDSECDECKSLFAGGSGQKIEIIQNQELHDKLTEMMANTLHK
ncbi:MAG: hypothetical protein QM683_11730 [Lacrimispora sp.]